MSNLFGFDDQIISDVRLNGIGWIGAMLVVGLSILAARFVIGWQLRRIERILARKNAAEGVEDEGRAGKRERAER